MNERRIDGDAKRPDDQMLANSIRDAVKSLQHLAEEATKRKIDVEIVFENFETSKNGQKAISPEQITDVAVIRREMKL